MRDMMTPSLPCVCDNNNAERCTTTRTYWRSSEGLVVVVQLRKYELVSILFLLGTTKERCGATQDKNKVM